MARWFIPLLFIYLQTLVLFCFALILFYLFFSYFLFLFSNYYYFLRFLCRLLGTGGRTVEYPVHLLDQYRPADTTNELFDVDGGIIRREWFRMSL